VTLALGGSQNALAGREQNIVIVSVGIGQSMREVMQYITMKMLHAAILYAKQNFIMRRSGGP
jgi:hypothetical protein